MVLTTEFIFRKVLYTNKDFSLLRRTFLLFFIIFYYFFFFCKLFYPGNFDLSMTDLSRHETWQSLLSRQIDEKLFDEKLFDEKVFDEK